APARTTEWASVDHLPRARATIAARVAPACRRPALPCRRGTDTDRDADRRRRRCTARSVPLLTTADAWGRDPVSLRRPAPGRLRPGAVARAGNLRRVLG